MPIWPHAIMALGRTYLSANQVKGVKQRRRLFPIFLPSLFSLAISCLSIVQDRPTPNPLFNSLRFVLLPCASICVVPVSRLSSSTLQTITVSLSNAHSQHDRKYPSFLVSRLAPECFLVSATFALVIPFVRSWLDHSIRFRRTWPDVSSQPPLLSSKRYTCILEFFNPYLPFIVFFRNRIVLFFYPPYPLSHLSEYHSPLYHP